MVTKYQMISYLAEDTAKEIAKNGQEWTRYLTTAARLYKYPFNEQILIFAQRPDATACASLELWNEKMNCWVNRGAKGIALLDTENSYTRLKYVFDVSDVHKARRIGRDPNLWELREEHKETVLAQLEKTYGETDKNSSFEQRIMEISNRIALDYYEELLPEIEYVKEGSFLEELDELNVGVRLRDTLSSSIAYTILSRCGADMELWKDEQGFEYISDFNTMKTLSVVGTATTDMCKPLLMEIGRTIGAYDRQIARRKAHEKANAGRTQTSLENTEKVLANEADTDYNALKRESEKELQNNQEIEIQSKKEDAAHETDIRKERGLSDSEPDSERGTGGNADEVRYDAEELLTGTPERDLSGHDTGGRAESTLSGDTGAGRAENGSPERTDGESRGSERGTESSRSDEVGSEDEQHQTFSGGDRADGTDLQLENDIQEEEIPEPEGTGYRAKTRFAKFFNLPELIALFKESADIQTPDMLKLPVPEAEYENVVLKPSEYQKEMVTSLADRAEAVRNRLVEPHQDNMLKITNDGRKLALDQRLINDMLPDEEHSKAKTCVDKAFEIWEDTKGEKSAQLIFCDLSTPKGDGTFNVYEDIRNKLMEKGVPAEEIAFIHQANTELRKAELFSKVRSGQVRFLLGSTAKMGAGTNVQDRLIALHHLDVPWRPSDIEQQEGRILRQGNRNPKVKIFRYVTEGTFDSYSWQLIENKQKFIGQIMTSKSPVRSCEDVDEAALSYAEVKALATGNPYIKEKMDLDIQVSKLKLMKANHTSQKYRLEDNIAKHYPQQITILKERISGLQADIQTAKTNLPADKEFFSMRVGNKVYTDKKEAGTALVEMCKEIKSVNAPAVIGEYAGFKMAVSFDSFNHKFVMNIKGQLSHNLEIGVDPLGNISRINHALEAMTKELAEASTKLENVERQLETAKVEVTKPFAQEAELSEKLDRLSALNALLNMDEKGDDGIGMEDDKSELGTEQVADTRKPYPIENTRHNYAVENGNPQGMRLTAAMADKPAQRVSLKEKLETMKVKAAGNNIENSVQRDKGKEEYL